jgi:hypothetical protein
MRISRLSILLTHMRFLYENPSTINQMGFLYENPSAINQMGFLYEDLSAINIAHSYGIFIWGSSGYQSGEIFIWGSLSYQSGGIFIWGSLSYQYCSPIWDFYMRIPRLSILLTHMRFLYKDLSVINIIDEHQTRWAFNHRWISNWWAFNYSSKLTVRHWISALLNRFSKFLTLLRSLTASRKNCPKSSYLAVYDRASSSCLLIHAFSRAWRLDEIEIRWVWR